MADQHGWLAMTPGRMVQRNKGGAHWAGDIRESIRPGVIGPHKPTCTSAVLSTLRHVFHCFSHFIAALCGAALWHGFIGAIGHLRQAFGQTLGR